VTVVEVMADGGGDIIVSSCEKPPKSVRSGDKWKRKRAKVCRNLGLEYVSDKTNKVLGASAVRGQRHLM
jgi:hypothetical protein